MTFVYLAVMVLIAFGIYRLYLAKTPEDERKTQKTKSDDKSK